MLLERLCVFLTVSTTIKHLSITGTRAHEPLAERLMTTTIAIQGEKGHLDKVKLLLPLQQRRELGCRNFKGSCRDKMFNYLEHLCHNAHRLAAGTKEFGERNSSLFRLLPE